MFATPLEGDPRLLVVRHARPSSKLPPAVQAILPVLAEDAGRRKARTLEMILGPGPDVVRQHIAQIDVALGSASPGVDALADLVSDLEHAISPARPRIRSQHFISRVVLRRFDALLKGGRRLIRFDLVKGKDEPRGAKGVATIDHFVRVDSLATEKKWGEVENWLHQSTEAALNGSALSDPGCLRTFRNAVALHFVRNPRMWRVHRSSFVDATERQVDEWTRTPHLAQFAAEAFRQEHGGLLPGGLEGLRIGIESSQGRLRELHRHGALFRLTVQRMFEDVCDRFETRGVSVAMKKSPRVAKFRSPLVARKKSPRMAR